MIHETISLWDAHPEATLTSYCISNSRELKMKPRRTVVVCPGGGYRFLSDREAEPIVFSFLAAGLNVFLLRYSVEPLPSPYDPLIEIALAIKHIRENAEKYNTDPNYIFTCGFSAGGHLAGSAGALWNAQPVRDALGITDGRAPEGINRPDGTILCYAVITAGEHGDKSSFRHLTSATEITDDIIRDFSLELHVDSTTPPAFLWHTFNDPSVDVQNSLIYASALAENGVPFELHIFPDGEHGLSLCNEITSPKGNLISPHCECWMELAIKWILDFKK